MNGLTKAALIAGALAIVACDKPQDAKPTDPASTSTTTTNANTNATAAAPAQAKAPDAVTIADGDLVSPADFESQEETAINAKNYKAAIASIETEMAKE